ncbi:MAG: DUF3107 domain-containing protein [Gordonia sp. (in: high G+C Gram-positive bacteria)]|uniref:DUF3107 domain-containing protein n=1 Tax=Gordonia sp. (in: high G+C Gram-positive bacteria) TaxID=84139 RepID=UPI0039E6042B
MSVEVKIGIENSPRELTVTSKDTQDKVYKAVSSALDGSASLLELVDEKGAKVLVPVSKIAYVEVGSSESRKIGFVAD